MSADLSILLDDDNTLMSRADVIQMLRESLRIEVETTSEYTGGMDGGSLYRDCHTLNLLLDGEVISSTSL